MALSSSLLLPPPHSPLPPQSMALCLEGLVPFLALAVSQLECRNSKQNNKVLPDQKPQRDFRLRRDQSRSKYKSRRKGSQGAAESNRPHLQRLLLHRVPQTRLSHVKERLSCEQTKMSPHLPRSPAVVPLQSPRYRRLVARTRAELRPDQAGNRPSRGEWRGQQQALARPHAGVQGWPSKPRPRETLTLLAHLFLHVYVSDRAFL